MLREFNDEIFASQHISMPLQMVMAFCRKFEAIKFSFFPSFQHRQMGVLALISKYVDGKQDS